MGMFDYINYEGHQYQTKDTPNQAMDYYEIRGDELWVETYDAEWIDSADSLFGGYIEKRNETWVFCSDFDGAITFYREDTKNGGYKNNAWIQYKALFMNGKIIKFTQIVT